MLEKFTQLGNFLAMPIVYLTGLYYPYHAVIVAKS